MSERQQKARNLLMRVLPQLPRDLQNQLKMRMRTLLADIDSLEVVILDTTAPRVDRIAALRRLAEIVMRGN